MLETAKYYAENYGFAVMPVHGINPITKKCTCGKDQCNTPDHRGKVQAGKHPWTINGLKNASSNIDAIETLWNLKKHSNIGIVTGPISGIFVLDIDGPQGESSLQLYGALPETLTSFTGNGRHLVFKYPSKKVYTRAGKFAPGLDIRGEGGYIVAPPSVHANGSVYQWIDDAVPIAEAPSWLLDIVCSEPQAKTHASTDSSYTDNTRAEKWTVDEAREMLSFLDPDCSYDEWISIGMALHNEGYSITLWDEWSRRGRKYTQNCTTPHWKSFKNGGGVSFGTLVHMASLSGWKPREVLPVFTPENHPAREFLIKIGAIKGPEKPDLKTEPSSYLIDPMKIPGLVGDTVRAIVETSQKAQPELALLNTLAALGAVFGRRYASPMDTRTNIYAVGIALTAAGKDHSRRFIKRLLHEAGLASFLGSDAIVSGPGVVTSVFKRPSQVMHLDEFGMLLEAITDPKGAHYMKSVSKVITEMYSSSSAPFEGGQYADKKSDPIVINYPNLCIYGTTTPDKYISCLNSSAIASGELNRFVILRPKIDRPQRRRYMGGSAPPETLVQSWSSLKPEQPNHSIITPDITTVSWSALEDRIWEMGLFEDAQIEAHERHGLLWGRYKENVIKFAMIFAIARNHIVPVMTDDDLDMAEAIVRQSIEYVMSIAEESIADSQHEKDCNDILNSLRRKGPRLSQSQLCSMTRRMDPKQRESAIDSLLDRGIISIETPPQNKGAGRRGRFICLTKN